MGCNQVNWRKSEPQQTFDNVISSVHPSPITKVPKWPTNSTPLTQVVPYEHYSERQKYKTCKSVGSKFGSGSDELWSRFVVVPNATAPNPAEWQDRKGRQWLRSIPSSITPGLAVFFHEVETTGLETPSWQNIFERGKSLWNGLVKLTRDESVCSTRASPSVMTNVASDIPSSYRIARSSSCHMVWGVWLLKK